MSKSFAFSIALLLIIASNSLYSQKFGIEAGYVQHERYGDQFKTTYFNGAKLGLNVEFGLKNNFSLLSGALYSVVYSSNTQNYTVSDSVNYKTFNHTIEVPLHLQYTLPVSKNLKFFAFAGPKLNFGLAQPQKVTVVLSGDHVLPTIPDNMKPFMRTESESYSDNDLYVKSIISRINLQMSVGGGVQFKNYQLRSGYDFGIHSINKVDSGSMLRQRGWYVSLVYKF
ncbi:MAG: outer membrane beta-barrel protein [Paludibacter sp.]